MKVNTVLELSVTKYNIFVASTLTENYIKHEKWSYIKKRNTLEVCANDVKKWIYDSYDFHTFS